MIEGNQKDVGGNEGDLIPSSINSLSISSRALGPNVRHRNVSMKFHKYAIYGTREKSQFIIITDCDRIFLSLSRALISSVFFFTLHDKSKLMIEANSIFKMGKKKRMSHTNEFRIIPGLEHWQNNGERKKNCESLRCLFENQGN